MNKDQKSWNTLTIEPILAPELPICDPHHHLWDTPRDRYLLTELLTDLDSGHRVTQTVFVECVSMYRKDGPPEMRPVGETEFVDSVAVRNSNDNQRGTTVAAGIVGLADLSLGGKVEEVLRAHIAASPKRFKGIRHASSWHSDESIRNAHTNPTKDLLGSKRFQEGFAVLEKLGLSFDAWMYHTQLADVVNLAESFPNVPIVLDHVGGPLGVGPYRGRTSEVCEEWCKAITKVSRCENVVVKLGGLTMPMCGFGWHKQGRPPTSVLLSETMAPYYLHCIEEFGVDRCMFESNFPVDKVSSSYSVLWNSFKRMTAGFSESELFSLFHDTAAKTYRLPLAGEWKTV